MDPDFNGTVTRFILTYDEANDRFNVATYLHPAGANPNAVTVLTHEWRHTTDTAVDQMAEIITDANALGS